MDFFITKLLLLWSLYFLYFFYTRRKKTHHVRNFLAENFTFSLDFARFMEYFKMSVLSLSSNGCVLLHTQPPQSH